MSSSCNLSYTAIITAVLYQPADSIMISPVVGPRGPYEPSRLYSNITGRRHRNFRITVDICKPKRASISTRPQHRALRP